MAEVPTRPQPSTPAASGTPFDPLRQPGVEVKPLAVGAAVEFPRDTAFIVELGCTQCDGATEGLVRVYRSGDGPVRVDTLVDKAFTLARGSNQGGYVTRALLRGDGGDMLLGLCPAGGCGEPYSPQPSRPVAYFRSIDGGITWQTYQPPADGFLPVALTAEGILLAKAELMERRQPDGRVAYEYVYEYRLGPDQSVSPPAGAKNPPLWGGAFTTLEESLWWHKESKSMVRIDGSVVMSFPNSRADGVPFVLLESGRPASASWYPNFDYRSAPGFNPGCYLTTQQPDGMHRGLHSRSCPMPAAWQDGRTLIANMFYPPSGPGASTPDSFMGGRATMIDIEAGFARPIDGAPAERGGRNRVRVVMRGPFARVTAEPCLNVRERPSTSAVVLLCSAPGVLLKPSGERQIAEGREWRSVSLPDGRSGWAASEGLE